MESFKLSQDFILIGHKYCVLICICLLIDYQHKETKLVNSLKPFILI